MKTINKGAADYLISLQENGWRCSITTTHLAYIKGAKQVLDELRNVLSVSEDEHLRTNIEKMIGILEDREREERLKSLFDDLCKPKI